MDFNIEFVLSNKLLKNKFEFINISEHHNLYELEIKYLDKDLFYIKVFNKEKKSWCEDIKIKLYSLDEKECEEISIGASTESSKEMEIYVEIELEYYEEIIRKNIQNNVLINKEYNLEDKKDYYEYKHFLYRNKFYMINNNLSTIYDFVTKKYKNIELLVEFIINEDLKLLLYVLIYLNEHGGIFINDNYNYNNLDNYNIDDNICYIHNNSITLIFSKLNFLNYELLLSDLEKRQEIKFEKYLNDFQIKSSEDMINYSKKESKNDFYTNMYVLGNYVFYILSNKNREYNLEKLPNNYFCLNGNQEIESDLFIKIFDKENNKSFLFSDSMIKNKYENNYIFKI